MDGEGPGTSLSIPAAFFFSFFFLSFECAAKKQHIKLSHIEELCNMEPASPARLLSDQRA